MTFIADLHIHSKYAYATSKDLSLEKLAYWAKLKGIDLLACGDFTHPAWFAELADKLEDGEDGLYRFQGTNFVLGTEVSCVYRQEEHQRRVHVLLFLPDLASVARLSSELARFGKLESDGRPTLKLSVRDLAELALGVNPQCLVIPAHVWTPWYGLYGSKSGFDRLDDAFLDMAKHIHAVETGLSSDPAMNWMVPQLRDKTIVSFSDAHSLPKLGREVTVFEAPLSYSGLSQALAENLVAYTAEFHPQEGKYHFDGHRKCGVSQHPSETSRLGVACPVCDKPLTLGVLHRVRYLTQQKEGPCAPTQLGRAQPGAEGEAVPDSGGFVRSPAPEREAVPDPGGFVRSLDGRPPFIRLLPLQEIIAALWGRGVATKAVQKEYMSLVAELGSELELLIWAGERDLVSVAGEELARAILQARHGHVRVEPGYDGVYGRVSLAPGVSSPGCL